MSGSRVARVSRATFLFLAGVLAASVLGTSAVAAPSVSPNAIQTRSVSCHGLNFHPIDSVTEFSYTGGMVWRGRDLQSGASGFFMCDPNLPHRATVTKVQFTVRDDHYNVRLQYCGLFRSSLKAGHAGGYQRLAQVPTTGFEAQPGIIRQTDSTISYATINTTDYAYELQCRIEVTGVTEATDRVGIFGADVVYTISSANG